MKEMEEFVLFYFILFSMEIRINRKGKLFLLK